MRMGMGVLLLLLLLLCIIHGSAGLSLQSPIVSRTHKYAPGPQIQDLVPPIPPSPATAMPLPSDKSAPLPQTMPHFTPSVSPSSPVVLPSHKAAPLPQTIPHFAPSSPPNSPIVVPSNKSAPPPEVMPKVEPSISPSPVVPVPSHNSAPLPQTMPEVKPSIPPSPPVLVPSHNSAPPSQTMPDVKPSIPPSSPVLVPSNNSTPPQTMPEVKPPIPSSPTVLVPSHKSPPPPQTEPQIEPSISPNPSNEVPTHTLVPLPEPMQSSPPVVVPSLNSTHLPQPIPQLAPSMPPNPPIVVPLHKLAPRPQTIPGIIPSLPPNDSPHKKEPEMPLPVPLPHAQAPVALTPMKSQQKPSAKHSIMPGVAPSTLPEPAAPPLSVPPLAAQPKETFKHLSPKNHFPRKGLHNVTRPSANVLAPHNSSPEQPKSKWIHSPAPLPSVPFYKHHHAKKRAISPPLAPHYSIAPTTHQGPIVFPSPSHTSPDPSHASTAPQTPTAHSLPPVTSPKKRSERRHNPVPSVHGPLSPVEPPFPSVSPFSQGSPAPLASSTVPVGRTKRPVLSPLFSPPRASPAKPKATLPPPVRALPPPPPNQDCSSVTCAEPLTNSPPGSPCVCVWPIKVELRFGVAPYAFFPLVSELAEELASGVFMKQSQVRIMGANAASQQLDKTDVLIDLVPLGENFDRTTALLIYQKFWHKQVSIKTSFFGDYEVLYVTYPGLPPSPPSAPLDIDTGGGYNQGNNARAIHPLGVDVRRKHKHGLGGSTIAIIVLSSFAAVVLCIGAAWILLLKRGGHTRLAASTPQASGPSLAKQSGGGGSMFGSGLSSTSLSFGSSITTYTGSAKTFSADEVEKATNNFDASRIIGEGGFGRVYKGILEDGAEVAIKVLKRDDQQGGREFLAEVEMLSRLHHRNLVKLIGICIEEQSRSLMYELIPNGSLESHLHGLDKETASLDWGARMKIALGAARGLAYLHEDSSPHVIHRDFKSSNILLEHDFTPKVSDFGLAKSALDEGNKHISTRVMGTFGYVAPEYAMTGHLLVKSDVYSYGVVLLELLTGRKPVDMSQPQGQENLVAWARPLLTSKEGLEMIIDPTLASNCLFDSVAKVAAIASMCVQPEVSHRPFMGEVVQALKLVCTECDEAKEAESESLGQEDLSVVDIDIRTSTGSGQFGEPSHTRCPDYDSVLEAGRPLSTSYIFNTSGGFEQQESGSFRRHSSSGPLRTGRRRQFWQRVRGPSRGSVSEHGATFRLWGGSH